MTTEQGGRVIREEGKRRRGNPRDVEDHRAYEHKALPHSEEAERAVLAAILLAPQVLEIVAGRLTIEDFYLERHQEIFRSMLLIADTGDEIDLRTLQANLELRNQFDLVGGMAYLAGLDLDLPDLGRIETYAEIVKERSIRRRLIQASQRITFDAFESGEEASVVLAGAESLLSGLGQEASNRGFSVLQDVYDRGLEKMQDAAEGGAIGVPTGFYDWDRMTQGLSPGNLIIVAGRPGMGKSSFSADVARHIAIYEGQPAAIFSLEMSEEELGQRIMAAETGLPFGNIRSGRLSEAQWMHLYQTVHRTGSAPLFIDDSPSPTIQEISAKCRRMKSERGLGVVVVDYLQLMRSTEKHQNKHLEMASLTRGFKEMSKTVGVPVIVLSQLSRDCDRRADKRPVLADLRESGAIEADADMVCFVYRDEIYNKNDPDVKGLAELIVAKHRNGPTGTVDLVFLGESTTFKNLDRAHGAQSF